MNKFLSDKQVIAGGRAVLSAMALAVAAAFAAPEHIRRAVGVQKPEMILDSQHTLSDAQALTVTAVSTNIIDLGVDRNLGIGEPMCVLITVDVTADATTGDETYQFDIETDDNSGFASPLILARRIVSALPNIPRATLAAGFKLAIPIPNDTTAERFIRLNYTLGGTTPIITVTAQLQPMSMVQADAVFAKGYTIS